jgi:hypothetical protein
MGISKDGPSTIPAVNRFQSFASRQVPIRDAELALLAADWNPKYGVFGDGETFLAKICQNR